MPALSDSELESTSTRHLVDDTPLPQHESEQPLQEKRKSQRERVPTKPCLSRSRMKLVVCASLAFGLSMFLVGILLLHRYLSSGTVRPQSQVQEIEENQQQSTFDNDTSPIFDPSLQTLSPTTMQTTTDPPSKFDTPHLDNPPTPSPSISPSLSPTPADTRSDLYPFPKITLAPLFLVAPVPRPTSIPSHQIYTSMLERLSDVSDPYVLEDRETPQGKAYKWIVESDEIQASPDDEFVDQRFVLAAFYFATGGGRTSATWSVCSAVPERTSEVTNMFSVRCVFEDRITICAEPIEFLHCREHVDSKDNSTSRLQTNGKKRWLSNASECDWFGVDCSPDGKVESIKVSSNSLVGSLIPELAKLKNLVSLDLSNNFLEGKLPDSWGALGESLEHVSLANNSFRGFVPHAWSQWSNLKSLNLGYNKLKGGIKSDLILNWKQIVTLNIQENHFGGELPTMLGELEYLKDLEVDSNKFWGTLPPHLGNITGLSLLYLGDCKFAEPIPPEIGALTQLEHFDLHGNNFSGTLPTELWQLTSLKSLNLKQNTFSGTLAPAIASLSHLQQLWLQDSGLSGEIPQEMSYLTELEVAHLEFNDFYGSIPESLCELKSLHELFADCDGKDGSILCSCCTQCCSAQNKCSDPNTEMPVP